MIFKQEIERILNRKITLLEWTEIKLWWKEFCENPNDYEETDLPEIINSWFNRRFR